jgi:hypothetical protein
LLFLLLPEAPHAALAAATTWKLEAGWVAHEDVCINLHEHVVAQLHPLTLTFILIKPHTGPVIR